MTFYTFYFFISVNTIQGNIVPPFDTLTIHDTYTWFHVLTAYDHVISLITSQSLTGMPIAIVAINQLPLKKSRGSIRH